MRSRPKTRRIRVWVLPVLLYGRPIAASYLRGRRSSINLRERTTYVPDLVCPPTNVITFASVTTLRRCLLRRNLRSYVIFRAQNSFAAVAAAPFIDSSSMYLVICREYDLISRSLPPPELYGYLADYLCRCP